MNHLLSSACSGLMSLRLVASGQLPGCGSQEVTTTGKPRGLLRPGLATHTLSHMACLVIHCTRARWSRAELKATLTLPVSQKAFRTLSSSTGAPPFLYTEHCFLVLELGHNGTKGVATLLLCLAPSTEPYRNLRPLTEQPDGSHCWLGPWQRWAQAKHDSLIGRVLVGRVGPGFRAFSTKSLRILDLGPIFKPDLE